MSTPRLLIDPDVPAFQRDLLRAWAAEGPSDAARERAMAFAAFAAVAGTAAAGAGGAATQAGTVGGSLAPKAISATALSLVKWLGVASLLAGLTASGAIYARSLRSTELAASGSRPSPPDGQAGGSDVPTAQPEPTPASTQLLTTPLTAATAPSANGVAPPSGARARSSSTPASTLSDQIASLDGIRTALGAGDASGAVKLVDDYERRFPRGAFVQEAEMLRIEALFREGNRDGANEAADRFVVAYPASPHLARLRALTTSAAAP